MTGTWAFRRFGRLAGKLLPLWSVLLFTAWMHGEEGGVQNAAHEAARLNNVGTALMNQQLLNAAAEKFGQASRLDPQLVSAELNKGIALLYLQKTQEAKQVLLHAAEMAPADPHTWYALGLLYRVEDEVGPGTQAFERVLTLDPNNADSHYFLGAFAVEQHDLDRAIAHYREALRLNPLHASAEFGLARALERKGAADDAHAAFTRFQHVTEEKLAAPITHNYGEEGPLGRVENAPL